MTTVFIGGSRKLTRLSAGVRERIDRMIEKGFEIVIGDANGADRAVQQYLSDRGYRNVRVYCSKGLCRNNVGNWETRAVEASRGSKGFEFYAAKDAEMTIAASIGFMLWDGKSRGTLTNVRRLLQDGKKVVVFLASTETFVTLRDIADIQALLSAPLRRQDRKRKAPLQVTGPARRSTRPAGLF